MRTVTNYTEFLYSLAVETERFTCALDYPDFEVWKDTTDGKYYWIDHECKSFCEVCCAAILIYSVNNEPNDNSDQLIGLFDCDVCGEMVTDDEIAYMWFKKINEKR